MFANPQKNIEQFHVDPGMRVADIGAGSGHYSIQLAKQVGSSGKVFAIDIQKDLLDRIKGQAKELGFLNVETVWGDIEKPNGTSLRDMSVDRVIFSNILFQIEHKDMAVKEIARIIKPKGSILIIDWTDSFGGLGPHPNQVIGPYAVKDLFNANGFSFERDIDAGAHHYGLIFKRHG